MPAFLELTAVILIATVLAFILRALRQPLVIGYIVAGIVAGPVALNVIHSYETVELFSKIGITILLFIVGLGLQPAALREVGKVSLVTGLGQVIFTSVIGFGLATALGLSLVPALYVAIALTFSSTIIILKLLSDKQETDTLYGKISIGFLLVQDLVATLILLGVSTFANNSGVPVGELVILTILKGLAVGGGLWLAAKYVLPRLSAWAARSQEMLFMYSISWGLGVASIVYLFGFSVEIGALLAGIALATTPYSTEIGARLRPLRDFFILLFFVLLGAQMDLAGAVQMLPQAVILSIFILIGNPLIVTILMKWLGYRRRTSFQAGLTVAQISEFSLILMALGDQVGHVSADVVSLVTLVGLITIAGSTYLILYSDKIYPLVKRYLGFFDGRTRAQEAAPRPAYDALLFGYNRVGEDFMETLRAAGFTPLVVDYDPEAISRLATQNIPHQFGDADDVEFLAELDFNPVTLIVSTIPEYQTNRLLVQIFRQHNQHGIAMVLSNDAGQALKLYDVGASYVLMPHYLGASHAAEMIENYRTNPERYADQRTSHQDSLQRRISERTVRRLDADVQAEFASKRARRRAFGAWRRRTNPRSHRP